MKAKVNAIKEPKCKLHGVNSAGKFLYINGKEYEQNKIYTISTELFNANPTIFTQIKEK